MQIFSGIVYHLEQPHAQFLFQFPIVFGINHSCAQHWVSLSCGPKNFAVNFFLSPKQPEEIQKSDTFVEHNFFSFQINSRLSEARITGTTCSIASRLHGRFQLVYVASKTIQRYGVIDMEMSL